ncbi:hypothetical protein ACTU45_33505 [Streptomyces sp. 24-1644]|uniref:hypothetical protein n=1 Tax=Streptomyces sp. 24-1644 TaxID=3457315 RepID=UPI003FA7555F
MAQDLLTADRHAQVEHLAVHLRSPHLFTLGFFILAERWEPAEKHAAEVCGRMLGMPVLRHARLLSIGPPALWPPPAGPWRFDP